MENLKRVAVGILGIMATMMIISIYLPSEVQLEKAVAINAPREQIFQKVSDLRHWTDWTVWQLPQETTLQSNGHYYMSRDGEFTVTNSSPFEIVEATMKIRGIPNIRSTFYFEENKETIISWVLRAEFGKSPYRKYRGFLFSRAIGHEMEMSLDNLKTHVETTTR